MSFVLKTAAGEWLQDQATGKDFFFPTKTLSSANATDVAPEVLLRQGQSKNQGQQAAAAVMAPASVSTNRPASPPGKQLSQSERNRTELPDITKGVPWLPNQVTRGRGCLTAGADWGDAWRLGDACLTGHR